MVLVDCLESRDGRIRRDQEGRDYEESSDGYGRPSSNEKNGLLMLARGQAEFAWPTPDIPLHLTSDSPLGFHSIPISLNSAINPEWQHPPPPPPPTAAPVPAAPATSIAVPAPPASNSGETGGPASDQTNADESANASDMVGTVADAIPTGEAAVSTAIPAAVSAPTSAPASSWQSLAAVAVATYTGVLSTPPTTTTGGGGTTTALTGVISQSSGGLPADQVASHEGSGLTRGQIAGIVVAITCELENKPRP